MNLRATKQLRFHLKDPSSDPSKEGKIQRSSQTTAGFLPSASQGPCWTNNTAINPKPNM